MKERLQNSYRPVLFRHPSRLLYGDIHVEPVWIVFFSQCLRMNRRTEFSCYRIYCNCVLPNSCILIIHELSFCPVWRFPYNLSGCKLFSNREYKFWQKINTTCNFSVIAMCVEIHYVTVRLHGLLIVYCT
jgi:hypothetical protein